MRISEVKKKTGLTKKAINYYEMKGLIEPNYHPENRYRDFSEQDLQKLALIAFLRQLNIPIDKIKAALDEKISMAELLEQHAMTLDHQIESLKNERELLLSCTKNEAFKNIHEINTDQVLSLKNEVELNHFKRENAIRAQWQKIFPGKLGRLFALIYNAYLTEPIDTEEKKKAWYALIEHLDQIEEIEMPPEIDEIIGSEHFERILREVEENFKHSFEHLSSMGKNQVSGEIPSPPVMTEMTREKVAFMKMIATLQHFLREEVHIYLSPVTGHLEILSPSYKKFRENFSHWATIIKSGKDFKSLFEKYEQIKKENKL